MLRLLAIQTFNWGYTEFCDPIPIGQMTLLYGDNGGGKSTMLNAIAILLGCRTLPERKPITEYIYEGENWAFIRAVADNRPDAHGRRPFDRVVPNPSLDERVTLACLLECRGGSWQRKYFIIPGDDFVPHPDRKTDKPFTQETYREAMELVGVRQALLTLLEIGTLGVRDMREPRPLFQFFLKLIGSEEIRDRYYSARRAWRDARHHMERLSDQLYREEQTVTAMGEQIQLQIRRRELQTRIARYHTLVEHALLRDHRKDLSSRVQTNGASGSGGWADLRKAKPSSTMWVNRTHQ